MITATTIGLVAAPLALLTSAPAQAASTALVINEVYGAGGNGTNPTYSNDFVELKNIGASTVVVDGWSVQYRSATGTSPTVTNLDGQIPAGATYLVQMSQGAAAGTATLPTPDATGAATMAGADGVVLLVNDTTAVSFVGNFASGVVPTPPASVVDMVGYGDGPTSFETANTGVDLTNVTSAQRTDGAGDTDQNANDFSEATPVATACGEPCEAEEPPPAGDLTIAEIQGTGAATPYSGQVVTTQGVVTASYPTGGFNGFVIQTGGTGGAAKSTIASDAIFVWGGSDGFDTYPAMGASVEVTGTAVEGSGAAANLTQIVVAEATEATDVQVLGAALPAVVARTIALPAASAREQHESELITISDPLVVSNSFNVNSFAEIGLAKGTTPLIQPTEVARPGSVEYTAVVNDNANRQINLDDGASFSYLTGANRDVPLPWLTPASGSAPLQPVRVGAKATIKVPLIFEYRNNTWKLQARQQVTAASDQDVATFENTRTAAPRNVGGDLSLATFNVLNYFNTTGESWAAAVPGRTCGYFTDRASNPISVNTNPGCVKAPSEPSTVLGPRGAANTASFNRQQAKIVRAINNLDADIVGLEEIENSVSIGEGDRDDAVKALVTALNANAGYTRWAGVASPPAAFVPAPADQDAIRTAFIYNPDTVETVGSSRILTGSAPFTNAREPLAQAFKPYGNPDTDAFAVIVNHFKSKSCGGESGDNVDSGDGQSCWNGDRKRQAAALASFASSFAKARGTDAVFLTGDFNSYSEEDPMHVLYDAGYDPIESPGEYTYSFGGLSGSLDHILGNEAAMDMVERADIWEANANESTAYQYGRFNNNVTDFYAATPYAASDHNPEIVGLDTTADNVENVQILGINDFHGRLTRNPSGAEAGAAVVAGAVKYLREETPNTLFAAAGDLIGASTFESFIQNDKPTIDALNAAGLDVSSVGNHEFDQGYDDLVNRVMANDHPEGGAEWKYLGANVKFKATGNPALPATWIKDFGDVEVGFVGAVTEHLPELVSPDGIADIMVTDIVDATNEEAADLKEQGADLVLLLVHEGAATTSYASAVDPASDFGKIVNGVSADVDAIVSGHTHLAYNHRVPVPEWAQQDRPVTKRPVVSAGQYGYNLNQLRYRIDGDTGEVLGVRTRVLALQSSDGAATPTFSANYPADPVVTGIVDDAVAVADVLGSRELGKIGGSFLRPRLSATADARGRESTLGNLVAEVQRWATSSPTTGSAQIAFMNPGGLRADMVPAADGTLTYRSAANVQPFANTLVNMDMTGAQLKAALEQQWQPAGASRPFLRLGASEGFTYTYDPTATAGNRIKAMYLDGDLIGTADTYSVTVNSFLASGGDNFGAFNGGTGKQDTGKTDLQGMVDYMAEFANTAAGDPPLPVDYSQRAVGVAFPGGAPAASYDPGTAVGFGLTSLDMTATGDLTDAEVQVRLDGETLGTFPVDHTAATPTFDETGAASVSVLLPSDAPAGAQVLEVTGPTTGTLVLVPITITGSGGPGPGPGPGPDPGKVATTTTGAAPSVTYGEPSVITATVAPAAAAGTVNALLNNVVVGSAELSGGKATITLAGKVLTPGTYPVTLRYAGNATHAASATVVSHTVTKVVPTMTVKAPKKVEVGDRGKVVVKLVVDSDAPLNGRVTLSIKGGQTLKGKVEDGKVVFKLPKAKAQDVGKKWKLKLVYGGTNLIAEVSDRVRVKIVDG